MLLRCLAALVALAIVPTKVSAGSWPTPAGGASASGDPELLLTFDDGPHEIHTAVILDALAGHGAQAIFFWTGIRVSGKPGEGLDRRLALVDRAVAEGHVIGNHTTSHPQLCAVSDARAASEVDDNEALFARLTGLPVFLLRIPYGARCKRVETLLNERGKNHLHWDLDPQEFRHHSADAALSYITRRLRRLQDGERTVLLMHDTQPTTAKTIPRLLDWIVEENERRAKKSLRPIRIVGASTVVEERYTVGVFRALQEAGVALSEDAAHSFRRLVPAAPGGVASVAKP